MIHGPLRLTHHAVDRYIERWRPGMGYVDARHELAAQLNQLAFVEVDGKDLIYRTPVGALLVVRTNGTIATVLPMGSKKTNRRPIKRRRR